MGDVMRDVMGTVASGYSLRRGTLLTKMPFDSEDPALLDPTKLAS